MLTNILLDKDKTIHHNRWVSIIGGLGLGIMVGEEIPAAEYLYKGMGYFKAVGWEVLILFIITELVYQLTVNFNGPDFLNTSNRDFVDIDLYSFRHILSILTGLKIGGIVYFTGLVIDELTKRGIKEWVMTAFHMELSDGLFKFINFAIIFLFALISAVLLIIQDDYEDFSPGLISSFFILIANIRNGIGDAADAVVDAADSIDQKIHKKKYAEEKRKAEELAERKAHLEAISIDSNTNFERSDD